MAIVAVINLRLATDDEGPRIAELVAVSGFTIDGLDWSEIYPHWLIAEEGNEIVGCIQIIMSKPVGWLELLSLVPDMGKKRKVRTVKALVSHGAALLKGFGAQVVMGCVQDDMEPFIKVLQNRGVVNTGRGFRMAKRL